MKIFIVYAFVSTLILSPTLALSGESIPIPGRWIVELDAPPTTQFSGDDSIVVQSRGRGPSSGNLSATAPHVTGADRLRVEDPAVQAYVGFLDDARGDMLEAAARELGRPLAPEAVYRHTLNGFAIEMSEREASRIAGMPGVAAVRQDRAYRMLTDEGPELIGANRIWTGVSAGPSQGEGVVIGVIDSGINWNSAYFSDDQSSTGGYEFTNPKGRQFGECDRPGVACNDKLIGVWDFTTEGTDGFDPEGEGHGSHVASIAAGNPLRFTLEGFSGHVFDTSGVAPRSNIISYKVCYFEHPENSDLDGRCTGSAIGSALEQAIEDGVDIVNYSIGAEAGDPWSESLAFLNIRSAGILFVSSAGNAGPDEGTITAPANAPWTFAVGSSTHRRRIGQFAAVAQMSDVFVVPGDGPEQESDISGPVIAVDTIGSDLLACSAFPSGSLDGAIAFVKRGDCTFEAKVNNATDAGAIGVLVYNNVPGSEAIVMGGLESTTVPSAMMGNLDGVAALMAIESATNPTASLFAEQGVRVNIAWEDRVSDFSARGLPAEVPDTMKPNVVAPGENILGAGTPDENSLAILGGTSMASPHVAGAAALLKSLRPDWGPDALQSALETTADPGPLETQGEMATILDRGAGRVSVDEAANAGLYLPVSSAEFQAADPSNGGDPSQLNLPGIFLQDCPDSCEVTRTVEALNEGAWSVAPSGPLDVEVTPSSFSLQAGQRQELTITVNTGGTDFGELEEARISLSPGDASMSEQFLSVGAFGSGSDEVIIGGTADEPTGELPLPVDPSKPCPAFYRLRIHSGDNSVAGRVGGEILLQGSGSRMLQGGLNFGGLATSSIRGFSAFSIDNATSEDQTVDMTLDAASSGRLTLERRGSSDGDEFFVDEPIESGSTTVSTEVPPGFYVVAFRPDSSTPVPFLLEALTGFADRPGGGFRYGAVAGGYHDPSRETSSWAGFCISDPLDAEISVLSSPTYGASGARGLAFSLVDNDGLVLVDTRD